MLSLLDNILRQFHPKQRNIPCIGQVRGQQQAKLALLIAVAGRHNLLLIGPPGEGKSFLASTIQPFLPRLTPHEQQQLDWIYSASNLPHIDRRPVRSVGPTITPASLIGGGRGEPIPGEISLAHSGVLFIDELPQFDRQLIDMLRQPLEDKQVSITRSGKSITYPCDFQFVAAMNPCLCGYAGYGNCDCSPVSVARYQSRISGPLADRIDMITRLEPLTAKDRFLPAIDSQSVVFLSLVNSAQSMQLDRFGVLNYELGPKQVFSQPTELGFTNDSLSYFQLATDKPRFSTRRTIRLARVSRTIADLHSSETINDSHIILALDFVDQSIGDV